MEFYPCRCRRSILALGSFNSQRDGILQTLIFLYQTILIRFNSQRDGILQNIRCICMTHNVVSIPNGMEFYDVTSFFPSRPERFNSQRDGILLDNFTNLQSYGAGFNSQRDGILQIVVYAIFLHIGGFNSQRDGILRIAKHIDSERILFQFPTGWNSTVRMWPLSY